MCVKTEPVLTRVSYLGQGFFWASFLGFICSHIGPINRWAVV